MKRVLVSEFMDEAAFEGFCSDFEVTYAPHLVDDRKALLNSIGKFEALIVRNRTQVDAELISAATHLRAVGRLGVGLDNIDLDFCRAREISVLPATGANAASVAEYVIGSALVLVRGAYSSSDKMLAGEWPRSTLGAGGELAGRTIGLVGFGTIARETAERARSLGMCVAAFDPHVPAEDKAWHGVKKSTLEELFSISDILSLHVPLIVSTRHLIDESAIKKMKSTAILVNTARGGIVDEVAVVEALWNGSLGGAALDVFETEPMTFDSAELFKDVRNLILTPHIAGVTDESNVRVSTMTVRNIVNALSDQST